MYNAAMSTVSVSDARASLPEILQRVSAGEEVTLTRHGVAVAVVVRPDSLRARRNERIIDAAVRLGDRLDAAALATVAAVDGFSAQRADELAAAVARERDR